MEYVKRAYGLISSHPIILLPQIGNIVISIIYSILTINQTNDLIIGAQDPLSMVTNLGNIMVMSLIVPLVIGFMGLIIYAGTGNMIKSAINCNSVSIKDFGEGIKKYLGKIVLSTLLAMAVAILASLVIAVIGVLLLFLGFGGLNFTDGGQIYPFGTLSTGGIIALVIFILAIIILAVVISVLISLWLPAIIMDNEGVISGFSKGFKAAKKNFWTILGIGALFTIIILAVVIGLNLLYAAINRTALMDVPPFHYMNIISNIITIILTTIFTVFLFLIYKDTSDKEATQGANGSDKSIQGAEGPDGGGNQDNKTNGDSQDESSAGKAEQDTSPDRDNGDAHIPIV
ncbi:MAG: hypothetical protein ACOYEJ_06055 [Mahellales bacterium]|jgi:uncharacterized membrane protein